MGLIKWFKDWKQAFKVSDYLEKAIANAPNESQYLDFLIGVKDLLAPSKHIIHDKIKNRMVSHLSGSNYKDLGAKYLDIYYRLIGDYKIDELTAYISKLEVENFAIERINDDQALSPKEIDEIVSYSLQKSVKEFSDANQVRQKFDYYITNWMIDNNNLSVLESDFILQKNEECYYKNQQVELFQQKNKLTRVNVAGPRVRIPIMKGLSYNIGSYNVNTKTEQVEVSLGVGRVNITNKRVLIGTSQKHTAITLSSIVGIEPYSNAVKIHKSNSAPITIKTVDAIKLYQYLNGIIRNSMN